jgi:hypothetical protein
MGPALWLPIGLFHIWWSGRYLGQSGRERFNGLSERRAQAVHELHASRFHDFLLMGAFGTVLLGLVFGLIIGSAWSALLWGLDAVVLLAALLLRRQARPLVMDAFRARQLQPMQAREHSPKRDRRQRQFGLVALGGFLLGETARFFAEREGVPALLALSSVALLVTLVAVGALLWSTAWEYGDEVKSH